MMKVQSNKAIAVVTAMIALFTYIFVICDIKVDATQTRKQNFSTNYSLTGDGATDILNVAFAQVGKTGSDLGYTEAWCANFVSDCADLAGQSAAIPRTGGVTEIKDNTLNAGGTIVSSPQPGDLVIWKNSISHVEIVSKVENGVAYSIGGNNGGTGNPKTNYCAGERKCSSIGTVTCYVRPNYNSNDLQKPIVSVPSSIFAPNSIVNITWTQTSGAINYWIDIWKNGEHISCDSVGNTYCYSSSFDIGDYGIFITANDGKTTAISDVCTFSVKNISSASVFTDRTVYAPGATVNINWTAPEGVTGYWIDIWKDGEGYYSSGIGNVNTYSGIFDKGEYGVFITAYNDAYGGWSTVTSEACVFYVNDINQAIVSTDFKYYAPGATVNINWTAPEGVTGYWIDIWKDGEGYYSSGIGNVNTYSGIFDKGEYGVFITAYNDAYGGWSTVTSEVCVFYITESGKSEKMGDLNQDGNITLTDLIPLQKHLLLRTNLTTEQSALADLNSDGMINVIDLMLLKRTLLNP